MIADTVNATQSGDWRIVRKYRDTHVVLSGGRTQGKVRHISEAEGMLALMRELGILSQDADRINPRQQFLRFR
jgi:hypothetical protein